MDETCKRFRYRAAEAVATAATVEVTLPDGQPYAQLDRRTTPDGRPRWNWRGGGLNLFSIELEHPGDSFLLTDPVGIPFGRIGSQGTLLPRLTAQDADDQRFVIDLDGRIRASHGLHRSLGRITALSPRELAVALEVTADESLATLLAAAPLCHAVAPTPAARA